MFRRLHELKSVRAIKIYIPCFLEACSSFHLRSIIALSSRVVADGYCTQRKCFMCAVNCVFVVALSASGGRSDSDSVSDSSGRATGAVVPSVAICSPLSELVLSRVRTSDYE